MSLTNVVRSELAIGGCFAFRFPDDPAGVLEDPHSVGARRFRIVVLGTAEELAPDVVVMGLRRPGLDGIEATRLVTKGTGSARVVTRSTFGDDAYVCR